ncbi:PEP-CTERM sorting domain-containing protein [Roseateles sp. DC23W]|uniref:PEP-CTERM sorting domain-containing protein n=1 Tax=Pelomonas dachongensis TaxID=3299029 RepID=A0ABW7EPA6_9BURK
MHLKTLAALTALIASPAFAATITFPTVSCSSSASGVGTLVTCANGSFVNQAHGDVAGQLDVSYLDVDSTNGDSLRWWGTGYNTLPSALWASGSDANSFARITLTPASGMAITLDTLDLGAYATNTRTTNLRVFSLGSAVMFSHAGDVGTSGGPSTFFPSISSTTGVVIEWENSAYNVGINNISYTLAPVPEPRSYALLLGGLAAVGLLARRRRAG